MESAKPLSEEEELHLRTYLYRIYRTYLDQITGDVSGSCSDELYVPYKMYVKDKQIVNPGNGAELFQLPKAVFTLSEFQTVFGKAGYTIQKDTYIPKDFREQEQSTASLLSSKIELLCEHRYFLLSVRIVVIGSNIAHQTILVFDREKKECIVIEPQIRMERVLSIYQSILARLGLNSYKLVEPPEQCVQAVAKDQNCMFWSLLLVSKYLRGSFPSIDAVSKTILAEYPTADALKAYINQFKAELYKKGSLPNGVKGGRQWVISTASRSKTRSRLRSRARKNRSKSLRSGRRTRRHA